MAGPSTFCNGRAAKQYMPCNSVQADQGSSSSLRLSSAELCWQSQQAFPCKQLQPPPATHQRHLSVPEELRGPAWEAPVIGANAQDRGGRGVAWTRQPARSLGHASKAGLALPKNRRLFVFRLPFAGKRRDSWEEQQAAPGSIPRECDQRGPGWCLCNNLSRPCSRVRPMLSVQLPYSAIRSMTGRVYPPA